MADQYFLLGLLRMINIRNCACLFAMNWLASRTICSAYKIRSFTPGATCRTIHSSSMKARISQSDVDGTMDAASGIDSLSKSYDSFIIDQWGVLHDGKKPYPGVTDCLQKLKDDGKNLILLSNSSKRKANSVKGLDKVGIKSALFDEIVTSGEIAWNAIMDRDFQFYSSILGEDDYVIPSYFKTQEVLKVFVIGNNDDDLEYISSCGCVLAPPETADFILARGTFCVMSGTGEAEEAYETMTFSGSPGMRKSSLISELAQKLEGGIVAFTDAEDLMAAIDPYLDRCIARNLPMLVSNPDYHRPGSGAPMPGLIGKKYGKLGGSIHSDGKPFSGVYNACMLAIDNINIKKGLGGGSVSGTPGEVDRSRICGVGDSLDHDILGARSNDIDSIWTANGVHSKEMGTEEGSSVLASKKVLLEMYEKYHITPTHTISSFKL